MFLSEKVVVDLSGVENGDEMTIAAALKGGRNGHLQVARSIDQSARRDLAEFNVGGQHDICGSRMFTGKT